MVDPSTSVNVSKLKTPIKGQRKSDWTKKQDPTVYCLKKTHLKYIDIVD